MVLSKIAKEENLQKSMAPQTDQPNPLQNPSIITLKWGRTVVCKSNTSNPETEIPSPDNKSIAEEGDSPEIMGTLVSKKSKSMGSLMKTLGEDPLIGVSRKESEVEKSMVKPCSSSLVGETKAMESPAKNLWNLRTRRSIRVAKKDIGELGLDSALPTENPIKPDRQKHTSKKEIEIPKLCICLTEEEIEEDFLAMKGLKPSRRPKKRAKLLQKTLDEKFPGLWLSHITHDSYKVHDRGDSRKN